MTAPASPASVLAAFAPRTHRRPVLLVLVLTTVVIGLIWFAALERVNYEHQQAVAAEAIKNDNLALAHAERIGRSLEVFDGALRTVRHLYLRGAAPRDLRPLLADAGLNPQDFTVLSVIGPDGLVRASNAPDMQQNFADRPYFKAHAADAKDELLVGAPLLGRQTGRWIVTLTRRIEAPGGGFGGVMFVAVDPAFLAANFERTTMGPKGVMSLVGLDGIARSRRSGGAVTFGDDVSKSNVFTAVKSSPSGHFVAQGGVDKVMRIASYHRMSQYPLITVVSSALDDVLAQSRERDHAVHASAALATLLAGGLGWTSIVLLRRNARALATAEAGRLQSEHLNRALHDSESRANRIIEGSPGAMIVMDAHGAVSRANQRAEALFGYAPGTMTGLPLPHLLARMSEADAAALLAPCLDEGIADKLRQGQELLARRRDGSAFPVEIGLAPLAYAGQRQVIAAVLDLTQREAMKAELLRQQDNLEIQVAARTIELVAARNEAQRLAQVKAQFLTNMSHEIRTPLNAISGMAHLIEQDGLTPEQGRRMHTLMRASDHLLSVINSILELSKIDAGALRLATEPIDLPGLVSDVLDMQRAAARARHTELLMAVQTPPAPLLGDAMRLRQALLNFVANAVKFTERGTISVRVTSQADGDEACWLRFEVEDTGEGIDPRVLPRLFKAFEQADNSHARKHGGTGLGLAITRMVAQLMGGDAGANSQVGQGSLFWFTARLPCAQAVQAAPEAAAPEAHAAPVAARQTLRDQHAGKAVLLVDDEPVNREIAAAFLALAELRVLTAADGHEALSIVQDQAIDLVLMDVQMPGMDGLEAARQIRRLPRHASLPIVALTASAFAEDRQACLDAGMDHFLAKPLVPDALFEAVLACLQARHSPSTKQQATL